MGKWASSSTGEPTEPHELWQNTDHAHYPGLPGPVDGSLFHGTTRDFVRTFCGAAPTPHPIPPSEEDNMITCGLSSDGNFHVF